MNGTDYTSLTTAVDFSSVETSLLAVGAVIVGILVVRKGIRWILGMVR